MSVPERAAARVARAAAEDAAERAEAAAAARAAREKAAREKADREAAEAAQKEKEAWESGQLLLDLRAENAALKGREAQLIEEAEAAVARAREEARASVAAAEASLHEARAAASCTRVDPGAVWVDVVAMPQAQGTLIELRLDMSLEMKHAT